MIASLSERLLARNRMNPRWPPTCSWREYRSKNRFRALVYLHSSLLVAGFLFAQGDENLRKRESSFRVDFLYFAFGVVEFIASVNLTVLIEADSEIRQIFYDGLTWIDDE